MKLFIKSTLLGTAMATTIILLASTLRYVILTEQGLQGIEFLDLIKGLLF